VDAFGLKLLEVGQAADHSAASFRRESIARWGTVDVALIVFQIVLSDAK
jgi:hypothetical protein